jgi:hypothetical protein
MTTEPRTFGRGSSDLAEFCAGSVPRRDRPLPCAAEQEIQADFEDALVFFAVHRERTPDADVWTADEVVRIVAEATSQGNSEP